MTDTYYKTLKRTLKISLATLLFGLGLSSELAMAQWRKVTVTSRGVSLRQFLPSCDAKDANLQAITDENNKIIHSKNLACKVLLFKDQPGQHKYWLPPGTEVKFQTIVPANKVRYRGYRKDIKTSSNQWVQSIVIDELKDRNGKVLFNKTVNPELKDRINKMRLVLHRDSLLLTVKTAEVTRKDRPKNTNLPTLSNSTYRCYEKLKGRFSSQKSRDGLRFLLYYYENLKDLSSCRRSISAKPRKVGRKSVLNYVNKEIANLKKNPKANNGTWTLSNLKAYKKWVQSPAYPKVGCSGSSKSLISKTMLNFIDKGQENSNKRFYMINPTKCEFVRFPKEKYYGSYSGKEVVTFLGHGGGYRYGSPTYGHRPTKSKSNRSRVSRGYVARCSYNRKNGRYYAGKTRVSWAKHNRENLSRPGLYITKNTATSPRKLGNWPTLSKCKNRSTRGSCRFNNIRWVGLDKRSKVAASTGVKMHARRGAPYFLSWGCPTFKPRTIEKLVQVGFHKNVLSLIWLPQCGYEKNYKRYLKEAQSGTSKVSRVMKSIAINKNTIHAISNKIAKKIAPKRVAKKKRKTWKKRYKKRRKKLTPAQKRARAKRIRRAKKRYKKRRRTKKRTWKKKKYKI